MTLAKTGNSELTKEEWLELVALKEAINYSPHTVAASKMEKFSELFVRSLEGKGDSVAVEKLAQAPTQEALDAL